MDDESSWELPKRETMNQDWRMARAMIITATIAAIVIGAYAALT